jgi:nucleoside-triphosphatase
MLRIAVTGRPGIGKTTLCLKVFRALKEEKRISGFITQEVRQNNVRKGFKLVNLNTGEEEWLAHIGIRSNARVGKYGVDVPSIDKFSANLEWETADLLIIDEIGPMELKSREFISMIERILASNKSCLFSIHLRSKHPLLERIRKEFEVIVIDERNRNAAADRIVYLIKNA